MLKGIAYFTELYEWKGLNKLYAHIIRQIENGLADWSKDFGEVETPLLIKYVKNDVKGRKSGDKFSEYKKNPKKEESTVFLLFSLSKKYFFTYLVSLWKNQGS